MRKRLKKLVSACQWLFTLTLILAVLLLVFTAFNPVKSFRILRVMSGSMEPSVKTGSIILVKKGNPKSFKKGDIITYRSPNNVKLSVTHRLVEIKKENGKTIFKTRGDANSVEDMVDISPSQVIGRVVFSLPFLGYLSIWIKKPLGFVLLVILPALFIIINEILAIKRAIEKEVEKKYAGIEKVVERKGKKLKVDKFIKLPLLIFFLLMSCFSTVSSSSAYFSSVLTVSSNTFSMGWWADNDRPTSAIDEAENDQGDPVIDVTNQPVHLLYHADDSSSGVNRVGLWFSYNDGNWQYYGLGQDGEFIFSFPNGDGVYRFLTVAVDNAGWKEDKNGNGIDDDQSAGELENVASFLAGDDHLFQLQYDTQPPTVALVVPTPGETLWQGTSALTNGDFQRGMEGWTAGGDGDHHIVAEGKDLDDNPVVADKGGQMFELGFRSQDKTGKDFLKREVTIPASAVPYLQFNYRMLSEDTVDYDQFAVAVESRRQGKKVLLKTGSEENDDLYNGDNWTGWQGDSGWRRLTANLQAFQGQEVDLDFRLQSHQNPAGPGRSWAYLSNIELHFLDPRMTANAELSLDVHDASGSGVDQATYQVNNGGDEDFDGMPTTLASGEATVSAQATDLAGNNSAPTKLEAKVMADVVLNRFSAAPSDSNSEWVELYNNSENDQDVAGWQICDDDGHCISLTANNAVGGSTTIESHASQKFEDNFYLNNDGDTIYLKDNSGVVQDKFSYGDLGSQHDRIWSRNPDGLGSWQLAPGSLTANITSRYNTTGKILLTVYNLPADYGQGNLLEYEITYVDDQSLEKGITGTILPKEVENSKVDREFYLGTCSSGGTCVTNVIPAHQVKLTLRQGTTVIINQKAFAI